MKVMKGVIVKIWPYLIILVVVSGFFWKFFLQGLVPVPADITVGMYFPWLDYKWGYIVGVPVKNPILSDVVSQIYQYKMLVIQQIKDGLFPLWNPFMFGGFPLLANVQTAVFNPTNFFYFVFPFLKAWSLQIILQPLLAALFTYTFLRYLKLGKLSSLLGGLTYAFSGFSIIWLEWGIHSFAVCFLPILLYFTARFYEERKIHFGILFSIFLALQIFAGYPQILIYSCLALALFVILKYQIWCKLTIFWAGFVLLGIVGAGIQLFPTLELYLVSQRLVESIAEDITFLPWRNIITFFAPDFFGNHSTMNFWGMGNYTNSAGYTGVVTLILATIGISSLKKNKNVIYLISLLVVSLLLAFPTPLALLFRKLQFVGSNALSATRILFLTNFSLACLASFGFDLLSRQRNKTYYWSVYLPLTVLGSVLIASFISYRMFAFQIQANSLLSAALSVWVNNLYIGMRNLVVPFGLSIFCFLFLILRKIKKKFLPDICLLFLFLLAILELFRFGWKYTAFSRPALIFPNTPVIDFLKKQEGIFRVDGGDAVPMNMLMPYGLESLSAYDPVYPLQMAQFLSLVDGGLVKEPKSRYGKLDTFSSPFFDLANICYVLAVKKDQQDKPDSRGIPATKFKLSKFEAVFEDKTVVVFKNKLCFPRAWLSRSFAVEKNSEELVKRMTDKLTDLRKVVFLEKEPPAELTIDEVGKNENLVWLSRNLIKQELEVVVTKPTIVFVADSYYPGWRAYIDGKQTEILRADFTFRAVVVPSGRHRVVFRYSPNSVKIGAIVSVISIITMLFLVLLNHFFEKNNEKII